MLNNHVNDGGTRQKKSHIRKHLIEENPEEYKPNKSVFNKLEELNNTCFLWLLHEAVLIRNKKW